MTEKDVVSKHDMIHPSYMLDVLHLDVGFVFENNIHLKMSLNIIVHIGIKKTSR